MALKKINKNAQGVPTGEYTDVAGGTLYADVGIGTILPFGGTSDKIPQGYLLCDGTSLLRASYPELFAVIGTAFGSADSTHFNIPDMRESVPKGAGLTGKSNVHYDSDGVALGEFVEDRIKSHAHDFGNATGTSLDVYSIPQGAGGEFYPNHVAGGSNSGSTDNWYVHSTGSDTNEVKSVGVNYIIKAKMVALPADFMSAVDEAVEEAVEFGEFEEISISSSSSTPTTIAKSGMLTIILQTAVSTTARVYVNGILVASSTQNGAAEQITTVTIPVTKGDSIYITDRQITSRTCHLRPYNFN